MRNTIFFVPLALFCLVWLTACSGGGGASGGSFTAGFMDDNQDGIYDPYQDRDLWEQMKEATSGLARVGARGDPGPTHGRTPDWRDQGGDGICDFSQDQSKWLTVCWADWIDENGDGICDNYPYRPQDQFGQGWEGGWR